MVSIFYRCLRRRTPKLAASRPIVTFQLQQDPPAGGGAVEYRVRRQSLREEATLYICYLTSLVTAQTQLLAPVAQRLLWSTTLPPP